MDNLRGLLQLLVIIGALAGLWKMFEKAGNPGWAALIPFYNLYLMLKMAGKPGWWLVGIIIPLVNIVLMVILPFWIADKFGKGIGYGFGMLFLPFIFYPVLGFGNARYRGELPGGVTDEFS